MSRDLYERLRKLGLTQYEARVYVSLIMRGTATASELSDISGVPYTRIYDVIAGLERKGMVVRIPGRPVKYKAVEPRVALKRLSEQLIAKYREDIKMIELITQHLINEFDKLFSPRRETGEIQIIRNRVTIIDTLEQILRESRKTLMILTPNTLRRLIRQSNIESIIRDESDTTIVTRKEVFNDLPRAIIEKATVVEDEDISINIVITDKLVLVYDAIPDDLSTTSSYDKAILITNSRLAEYLTKKLQPQKP